MHRWTVYRGRFRQVERAIVLAPSFLACRIRSSEINRRTWRSIPAGLSRFLSSTAFSSSARDKSACSPSPSPNMFASLKPPLALLAFTESPKPGVLLLMLFLLARYVLSDGRRPPVSVADSCARMLSICDAIPDDGKRFLQVFGAIRQTANTQPTNDIT